jgi:hypothetical protein
MWNDTYRFNIYLYTPADAAKVCKESKYWGEAVECRNTFAGKCLSMCHKKAGHIHLIFLRAWHGTAEDYGVLSHELSHMVHNHMDFIGHEIRDNFDEPHAYLLGWAMAEAVKGLRA